MTSPRRVSAPTRADTTMREKIWLSEAEQEGAGAGRMTFPSAAVPVRVLIEREVHEGCLLAGRPGQVFLRWMTDDGVRLGWVPTEQVRRMVPA